MPSGDRAMKVAIGTRVSIATGAPCELKVRGGCAGTTIAAGAGTGRVGDGSAATSRGCALGGGVEPHAASHALTTRAARTAR
jgi:hypothetical protein